MGLFSILFGSNYSRRARRDQRTIRTSFKNFISPINRYGTCFGCSGSGRRTFDCGPCHGTGTFAATCRTCGGSGTFTYGARPCFTCDGTGIREGQSCRRCAGTGEHKPSKTVTCKKCNGAGQVTSTCRRCDGTGDFSLTCRKCGGSGWHRF